MSQISTQCPACKQPLPVRAEDLEKILCCPHCQKQFRLERLEDYLLIGVLGAGAFGIVYRAYDLRNRREVALKQLNEKAIPEHEFDSWVQRRHRGPRPGEDRLSPQCLAAVHVGRVGKSFFMVTPVIRGETLDKIIPTGGFPDPLRAVQLAITILRALQHVHGFKIYHRDVKPSNIMIDANGNLFLVDFGLASCRQIDTSHHTEMGTVLGTPAYMPPEQARGEVNRIGPWSDQYGAGAVLFKMLTENVPYPGKGYAVLADVGNYDKPPKRPREFRPDLDVDLEKLVLRALENSPENGSPAAPRLPRPCEPGERSGRATRSRGGSLRRFPRRWSRIAR